MLKQLVRFALVLLLVSVACDLPFSANTSTPQPSPRAVAQVMVSADPNATATPTPFQPLGPTPKPSITATSAPSTTPEAGLTDVPPVPTPIQVTQPAGEGIVNLLVMGNDFRPNQGFRTDVMMLVSINKNKGTVSIISFPRDLYVTIPGWMNQRLNTAFPHGGFATMAETFQYNFGIRPKYYIMTNFQEFVGIINSMGGINVQAGASLTDSCDLPQSRNGRCTVNPGTVSMDGATALWYVRSRHTTSDFDRTRRAQEVLYAIFAKLMSVDAMSRLPQMYADYKGGVETNMGVEDMLPLLPVSSQILSDSSRIHRYAVTPAMTTNFITSEGAMVLLPNFSAISAMITEAVSGQ